MKKLLLILAAAMSLFTSCSKDDDTTDRDSDGDKIYPVHIKFYADDLTKYPSLSYFQATDSTKTGKSGMIQLRNVPGKKELYAFDWSCSIEWNDAEINRLVYHTGQIYLICDRCGSRFDRFDGKATDGVALERNKNLKRYQVIKQSDGSYLITN